MAVFDSGAKSSEEKPRYDLIPIEALEREAARMAHGAKAHGENNYRIGKDDPGFIRDRVNHLIEHALKYAAGDRSDDHLAAIRCNTGMLMWIEAEAAKVDWSKCRECGQFLNHGHKCTNVISVENDTEWRNAEKADMESLGMTGRNAEPEFETVGEYGQVRIKR